MQNRSAGKWTRRGLLVAAGLGAFATGAYALKPLALEDATPGIAETVRNVIGGRTLVARRILLEAPELTENGRVVPVEISVDSAMNGQDRVEALHILIMGNPQPEAASYRFGPDCGRARVGFRCRLSKTSTVVAVALLGDGTACMAERLVRVGDVSET